jgi:PAS domain S-box-containing protein
LGTALCQYNDLYDFAPVGYFTLDSNGQIQQSNLAGAHLLGVEHEKLFRQDFGNFISNGSRAVFNAFFEKLSTNQGKETCELELQKNGEASIWASIEASCFEGGLESRVVVMDITARTQAEAVIHQCANELEMRVLERTSELVHANDAKDEFLASMSHELRTPLSSILGYCELLSEGMRGPLNEKQQQAVGVIQTSGQHLLGLINDILDLSKIDAGKFEIHPERFEVNQISESSLNFIKHATDKKTITVEYSPAPDTTTVFADPMRLKQILINLLHNAVKFTPENGSIKLKVQTEPKEGLIRFSVTDTGIGIKPEDQTKLFKPFVQIDGKLSRQYEGTGLGLSLAKKLVELHGGHIEMQSEFGKGSCFTFILPWDQTLNNTSDLLDL